MRTPWLAILMMAACSDSANPAPDVRRPDTRTDTRGEASAPCGPATCQNGCCTPSGSCVTTPTDKQCGRSGGPCLDCTLGQGTCAVTGANGAYCQLPATCTPSSCPTGCCELKLCWTGASPAVCGKGGAPCEQCTTSGRTCEAQACAGAITCDAASCPDGCCNGGKCTSPATAAACGTKGSLCLNCTLSGQKCVSGACN